MSQTRRQTGRTGDVVIRWSTAAVVVGVAAVAAYVSYQHARELVAAHGETGVTARLVPLTVDGLVYASSMAMLEAARQGRSAPRLARYLLAAGVAATLAANVAHGAGGGIIGAAVSAWPAVALVGSYELLMTIVRGRGRTGQDDPSTATRENHVADAEPPARELVRPGDQDGREYDARMQDNGQDDVTGDDETFAAAREVAEQYRRTQGRWITRDELRAELHCSTERATELLRALKQDHRFAQEGATEAPGRPGWSP